jgi:hypothetical protein
MVAVSDAPLRIVSPTMRRLAIVLWIVAVALIPIGLLGDGLRAALLLPVPSVFTAYFAWLVLWRPQIELHDDHFVIIDVRRRTLITWSRVLEVRSRYGLEIRTSEGLRRVWIAPTMKSRLRALPATDIDVAQAAEALRERVPEIEPSDGPPPATVHAAPITTRAQGWSVLLLVALGIAASMTGARV